MTFEKMCRKVTAITLFLCISSFLTLVKGDQDQKCEKLIKKWTLWTGGLAATLKVLVERNIESWNIVVDFNKHFTKLNFFNALSNSTTGIRKMIIYIKKTIFIVHKRRNI